MGEPTDAGSMPDSTAATTRADGSSSPWVIVVSDGPRSRRRVEESWLCLADGHFGTRGSLEEDGPDAAPAVVAASVYERHADGTISLLQGPGWTTLPLPAGSPSGSRELDMSTGILSRTLPYGSAGWLRTIRLSSLARPGTMILLADLPPGYEPTGEVEVHACASTLGGGIALAISDYVEALPPGLLPPMPGAPASSQQCSRQSVVRIACYDAASSRRPSVTRARRRLAAARALGPYALVAEHTTAWASRWEDANVEITGDEELSRAVRFSLFHLMASVASRGEAPVGARGLSGLAYAGHVFWDADVFVLPFLAATHPPSARAMLEYRIRRLPQARDAAIGSGRRGARFPWESAHDGTDVTPRSGIDEHGTVVPILTGDLEEHIVADVAWAAWQLASWSGSWRFLDGPGGPLVVDTARYWASRARLDADGRAHIDHVIGPDEYHEGVDDDAFTNLMAAWNLRRGAELLERTGGSAEHAEAARFKELAGAMVDGYSQDSGIYEQFTGYAKLEAIMATDLGTPPVAADLVLGRERLEQSQIIKQADVLMAHHMIPASMRAGSLAANLDYYLPRTAHGSSLSPSVHSSLLARCGRLDEAVSLLQLACDIDLTDLTGSTAGGLHMANMGGIWQALVIGFAGIQPERPDENTLRIDPHIPEQWGELRMRIRWHNRRLSLRCSADSLYVGCDRAVPVQVAGRHRIVVQPPGRWFR